MAKEKWNMENESDRRIIKEKALYEARSYVTQGHPNIPHKDDEIEELLEHVLTYKLEKMEPSDEWIFRDIFTRNFLAEYKKLLDFYDDQLRRHEEYQRVADRNLFYGKDRPIPDLLSPDVSLKEFKRRIRKGKL